MESNYSPGLSRVSKQYLLPFQYFWDGFRAQNRGETGGKIPNFRLFCQKKTVEILNCAENGK